ncbi:MAG: class I SAM-dependent methyltransferase [Bdellovibrionota bacterium]
MTHDYGADGGKLFEAARKAGHGREFLNARLNACLAPDVVSGRDVADLGCGAGTVSIQIARNGAKSVFGQDIQQQMIDRCLAGAAELPDAERQLLTFERSNACDLQGVKKRSFDICVSVNVGCNMTSRDVFAHLSEMRRIMRRGGRTIFTFPDNLNVMFTDGKRLVAEVAADISERLKSVDVNQPGQLQVAIGGFSEGLFCTIVQAGNRFYLVDNACDDLPAEVPIYRKIPGLVVPNYWHRFKEYEQAIKSSGFRIVEAFREKFEDDEARIHHNLECADYPLGPAYTAYNAFTVLELAAE